MNAVTPEQVMRSRYEAFAKEDWQYIADTSVHQSVEDLSDSVAIEWLKLDVLDAYENIVEFKAYYRLKNVNSKIEVLHEISTFIEVDNQWKYKDGTLLNTQIQRNEPCPCGSGKKFKKCCA